MGFGVGAIGRDPSLLIFLILILLLWGTGDDYRPYYDR